MRSLSRTMLTGALLVSASAATLAVSAPPVAALTSPPTVTVTMTDKTIALSFGTTLHAGRIVFKVVAPSGDHALQLLRLTPGYSVKQASHDIDAGFSGNIRDVRIIDKKVHFLGGAEAVKGRPGYFAETMYAGRYLFLDQDGPAKRWVTVVGTPPLRAWLPNNSTISAFNYGFKTTSTLPRSGWTLFTNKADEPHLLVLQQVKPGTTAADVTKFLGFAKTHQDANPSWALSYETSAGVISPHTQMEYHLNAPAGRYILVCFWPDDVTGMPHVFMGMWTLVTLK